MTRLGRTILISICLFGLYGVWHAMALAQGTVSPAPEPTPPPITMAAIWPMVAMLGALAWGYLSRKLSDPTDGWLGGFFHKPLGHLVITFVGALVGAAAPVVQHWGVTGYSGTALAWALLGAASSFVGALSPSPAQVANKLQALVLPLLFVGAMVLNGCAWAKCELNYLPQTLEAALVEGVAIAMDTSKTAQDLLDFAKMVAPNQEDCFLAAIEGSKTPAVVTAKAHTARAVHAARGGHACRMQPSS